MRSLTVIGDIQRAGLVLAKGWRRRRIRLSPRLGRVLMLALALSTTLAIELGPGVSVAGAEWIEPIAAPVIDPFRPPSTLYGRGNRGLEYGDSQGLDVVAVDSGRVVFSGTVGHHRHVVVDHGSGLRSTYAYLESATVARGQTVRQGQRIGRAASGFHLTARLGDTYVDPNLLFAGAEVVLQLTDSAPPSVSAVKGNDLPGPLDRPGMFDGLLTLAGLTHDLRPSHVLLEGLAAVDSWHRVECSDTAAMGNNGDPHQLAEAGEGRILIQVGGLGSQAGEASIGTLDALSLGYDPDSIAGFSYAGGCTPGPFGLGSPATDSLTADLASGTSDGPGVTAYGATDTYQSIDISATRLANLLEATALARPGQPIDIAAHSLGGVVTRRALEILDQRRNSGRLTDGAMPSVVITIGSPHGGAPLGDGALIVSDPLAGSFLPLAAPDWIESDAVREISRSGPDRLPEPGQPPDGVRVVAVAGSGDLIVPAPAAIWPDATNSLILPSPEAPAGHSDLPSHPDVALEFGLALRGMAARCVSLVDTLAGAVASSGVSLGEQAIDTAIGIGRWLL